MPRSKNLAAYPSHFSALLSQAGNISFHHVLRFASKKEAEVVRSSWYGFLSALRHSGRLSDYDQGASIICRMRQAGDIWEIEFRHRDNDPAFRQLQEIPFFSPSFHSPLSSPALEPLPPPKKDNLLAYLGLEEDESPPSNSPVEF